MALILAFGKQSQAEFLDCLVYIVNSRVARAKKRDLVSNQVNTQAKKELCYHTQWRTVA